MAKPETSDTILKAHKIRVYPNDEQSEHLTLACDYRRNAFNWAVAEMKKDNDGYWRLRNNLTALGQWIGWDDERIMALVDEQKPKTRGATQLSAEWTQHKETETELYARYDGKVAQHISFSGVKDAVEARDKMFQQGHGFPRFTRKGQHERAKVGRGPVDCMRMKVEGRKFELPFVPGRLRLAEEIRFEGELRSATLSVKAGKWFISFLVDTGIPCKPEKKRCRNTLGVDVGVRKLATTYNKNTGEIGSYDNPKATKQIARNLKRAQRKQARCQGSKKGEIKSLRWKQLNLVIQRLKMREGNIRRDAQHKASTDIIRKADRIVVESLNVKGMMTQGGARKKNFNRALGDAAMSELLRQLTYKAKWEGKQIKKADQFYASNKICSDCGVKNEQLMAEEVFSCSACGVRLDRNLNAAINLARLKGTGVSVPTGRQKAMGEMAGKLTASADDGANPRNGKHTGNIASANTVVNRTGRKATSCKASCDLSGGSG